MNPTIKATGTATGWTFDSINIYFPATTAVGDGVCLFIWAHKSSSASSTPPTLSGWTQIVYRGDGTWGDKAHALVIYHKIAEASDISTGYITVNWLSNIEDMNGIAVAISNSPASARILYTVGGLNNTSGPSILSGITPEANSLFFAMSGSYRGATGGTYVTDVSLATDDVTFTELTNSYTPSYKRTSLWSATRASANTTGNISFSYSQSASNLSGEIFISIPPQNKPVVTTQAVSSISNITATGNGNVTSDNGYAITERGICWKTSTGPTTSDSKATSAGTTGSFTASMTGLSTVTTYYVRAYAINANGTSYGSEVTFTTLGWNNPTNAYASDDSYMTLPVAISGAIGISLSKDGGTNYTSVLSKTYDGTEGYQSFGNASTELWGTSFTGDDIDDTSFRLKISHNGNEQIFKNFGFALSSSQILTGIDVSVEAKYESGSTTISVDHIRIKVYYGTSVLPIQAGSMVYASNIPAGGSMAVYNGSAWMAAVLSDTSGLATVRKDGNAEVEVLKIKSLFSSWTAGYGPRLGFWSGSDDREFGAISVLLRNLNNGGHAYMSFSTRWNETVAEKMRLTAEGTLLLGGTTYNANAIADFQSTTKAFMPPRMTTDQMNAIASPTEGMLIYNTTTHSLYDYNGTAWAAV